jgi:signal transduction histidine kinase
VAAPVLGNQAPLLLFLLAVTAAAWTGGAGPGVFALMLGQLLGDYFFIEPAHTLGPRERVEWAFMLGFLAEGGVIIAVTEALRSARSRFGSAMSLPCSEACLEVAARKEAERARQHQFEELRATRETLERQNEEMAAVRQTLEDRVRTRTSELEAANRELEAFSYSVSHDLRAPLRSISGFSKAVLEEYQHQLDARGVTYLQYAYDASQRMNRLIEDLITLSRYTRCELRLHPVDLSALARGIVDDLRNSEPQRQVRTEISAGLKTTGDEGLLRVALDNLLRNSWKFTSKQASPVIEVGAVRNNGGPLFYVRDNGAGFNMQHADRLFGVFQRLHSLEEFPGTGIGLATVKRIFNRHGGDIWAEGRPNEGATFYFTLPEPAGLNAAPSPAVATNRTPSLITKTSRGNHVLDRDNGATVSSRRPK